MSEIKQRPFSIKIFVQDGDPDGLRQIEKSNWTGLGIVFNRTYYKQVIREDEFNRTGVYVLIGSSDESSQPTIYVGEGDPVKDRLNQHYINKDFWDRAIFFVTKDHSLNKAHVQWLEYYLIKLAKEVKQCKLDNSVTPLPPTLSNADTADMKSFVLDMLSIFPLLGLSVFEKIETNKTPKNTLFIESKGIKASGYEDTKGIVVFQGSQLVKNEVQTIHPYMTSLRKDLLDRGVIAEEGQHYVFTQNHTFSSPSTAAGVILGRTANGRVEWKTEEGTTLKEIQTMAATQEATAEDG